MNRREMIRALTRGSMPVLMDGTRAFAQTQPRKYELLLKGGRVIDPSQSFNALADVAIAGDLKATLQAWLPKIGGARHDAWIARIEASNAQPKPAKRGE